MYVHGSYLYDYPSLVPRPFINEQPGYEANDYPSVLQPTVGGIINMMCGSLSSVTVSSAEGGLEVGIVKQVPPCWVVELYWLTSGQGG